MNPKFLLAVVCPFLFACEEESKTAAAVRMEAIPGKIEIFNNCGVSGAATEAKDIFRANGFDVLSVENGKWSNYEETIVAIRNPHWAGQNQLKTFLDTKNFIVLLDTPSGYADATVFLGKDYKKVLRIKRGEL
jgi:hypothetical protein